MSLEKCIIQEGYYGNACSFEDLSIAVKQLTATSEKQLEEIVAPVPSLAAGLARELGL